MKFTLNVLFSTLISILFFNCASQKGVLFKAKEVYKSKDLIVIQVSKNSFIHTSYLQTTDFGNVPCNGLVVKNKRETIVFDTPTNDKNTKELIKWIEDSLQCTIKAVVPTHFHNDCLGGLKSFDERNIPSFANVKTIELAKDSNLTVPKKGFKDSLILNVGDEQVFVKFFGEGHTKDNVVAYFPSEKILFGGCLIKTLKASKGFLGDANQAEWSNTVEKVKRAFPNVKTVVPGHGEQGTVKLLDYSIELFRTRIFGENKFNKKQ
ncbi:MAG: subclass B1 metallo-beta-lactamase [Saprospiraceae bacterium]|nr:subclass B1 metallo-beta-lactamase [Saprospiraceae bacterium]